MARLEVHFAAGAPESCTHVDTEQGTFVLFELPAQAPRLPADTAPLSPSEREVLASLLDGLSDAEIATARGRSIKTVAKQVREVYRKLGVGSRRELWARLAGDGRPVVA